MRNDPRNIWVTQNNIIPIKFKTARVVFAINSNKGTGPAVKIFH